MTSPSRIDALRLIGGLAVLGALALAVTRVDAGPGEAAVKLVDASGAAALTKSVGGDAVLSADGVKPGGRTTGTVTVENAGDATGAFELTQTDVLDTPGAGDGRLSTAARLHVDDAGTARPVYSGVLGAMEASPLGYLRAGQKRTYRFTLTLPSAAPADAFAGARVETKFDWTAKTGEPPDPDRASPQVVAQVVGSERGRVLVAVTADRRSTITGLSRGARTEARPRLVPGRPALVTARVSRGASLPLRITVADAAGNRTAVTIRPGEE